MVCKQSYIPSLGQIGQSFSVFTKGKRERNKMLHKHLHLIDSLTRVKDHWKLEKKLPAGIETPPPKKKKTHTVYKQFTIPLITAWFFSSKFLKDLLCVCMSVCVCLCWYHTKTSGWKKEQTLCAS